MAITKSDLDQRILERGLSVTLLKYSGKVIDEGEFQCTACKTKFSAVVHAVVNQGKSLCPKCGKRRNPTVTDRVLKAKLKELGSTLRLVRYGGSGRQLSRFKCVACKNEFDRTSVVIVHNAKGKCPECNIKKKLFTSKASLDAYFKDMGSTLRTLTSYVSTSARLTVKCCVCKSNHSTSFAGLKAIDFGCVVCNKGISSSGLATDFIQAVAKKSRLRFQHAGNIGEYRPPEMPKSPLDAYNTTYGIVIEVNGDKYHGNPKIYGPDEHCHPFDPTITAGQLYQRTMNKVSALRSHGYVVISVWESDIRNRHESTICSVLKRIAKIRQNAKVQS